MQRSRLMFLLVSMLFAGWVMGLGAMAFLSADRPRPLVSTPIAR